MTCDLTLKVLACRYVTRKGALICPLYDCTHTAIQAPGSRIVSGKVFIRSGVGFHHMSPLHSSSLSLRRTGWAIKTYGGRNARRHLLPGLKLVTDVYRSARTLVAFPSMYCGRIQTTGLHEASWHHTFSPPPLGDFLYVHPESKGLGPLAPPVYLLLSSDALCRTVQIL